MANFLARVIVHPADPVDVRVWVHSLDAEQTEDWIRGMLSEEPDWGDHIAGRDPEADYEGIIEGHTWDDRDNYTGECDSGWEPDKMEWRRLPPDELVPIDTETAECP